jgi:MoxR-like ATPase
LADIGYRIKLSDFAGILIALRVRPFVIFSGRTGTGKTLLPRLLAELFQWDYFRMAVNPAWADPSDLLGFVSPVSEAWVPGALSPVLQCTEPQCLMCLDEFNVAKVEHYFSDFLSAMGTGEGTFWGALPSLEAINRKLPDHEKLEVPNGLKVIATMNFDDSVQSITPRVLDRANVIEFDIESVDSITMAKPIDWSQIQSAPRLSWAFPTLDVDLAALDDWIQKIWAALQPTRGRFGYRVAQEMRDYVARGLAFGKMFGNDQATQTEALVDRQIAQRVLPKFHGVVRHSDIRGLFDLARALVEGPPSDDAKEQLDNLQAAAQDGRFPATLKKISQLAQTHMEDGYAAYWV